MRARSRRKELPELTRCTQLESEYRALPDSEFGPTPA